MSSPALTSADTLVAVRPNLRRSRAIAVEMPRGPLLVLGGAESALAFCRLAKSLDGDTGPVPAVEDNGHGGFLPMAITVSGTGNGHTSNGNGFTNGNGGGPPAPVGAPAADGSFAAWELTADRLRQVVAEQAISEVVIADREIEKHDDLVEVLLDCKAQGVRVRDSVATYEELFHKVRLESLTPRSLLYADRPASSGAYPWLKRAVDLVLGTGLLLLAAPLMALVAAAVRLETRGPVIFSQERVGLRGRTFRILKFRSMRPDAEKAGPRWAGVQDDRVTRVGAFLRKHHLDELPQLINVLRGEMSLVGPRPERPCFVQMLRERIPYFGLRHHVLPGITGWAQVEYEYGDSVEDAWKKLQYDLYYTKNASLSLDLRILLKTVRAVLLANGR